jgi:outer membrane protein TolC
MHSTNVPAFQLGQEVLYLVPYDNTVGAITVRQAIYTGGAISGNISREGALYDMALSNLGVTQAQIALQTRQAYYSVLLNQALVTSARESLDAAQKQLTDANSRYEAGTAAEFDVLRAKTEVSQAQQTLTQNLNQVEISRVALNRIVNVPLGTTYVFLEPGLAKSTAESLQDLISKAEKQRAEVLGARAQMKAAEYGVRVARSAGYPQVGISASYQNLFNHDVSQVSGWAFVANVTQEIFDAGRIRADVKQAKAMREQAEISLQDTIQSVEQDVRQAYLNLKTAQQTLVTAQTNLAQASDAYDVATVRYEAGVGTATELADAFATLTAGRVNVDTGKVNVNLAFAALQRAMGVTN